MRAAISPDTFDKRFEKPARPTSRFDIRRRMNEHPMVMFATIIGSAFVAMAMHPTAGSALASVERAAPAIMMTADASPKGPRLKPLSEVDVACHGQNWGAESESCLLTIARESGREEARKVRMIASIAPEEATTPNVF